MRAFIGIALAIGVAACGDSGPDRHASGNLAAAGGEAAADEVAASADAAPAPAVADERRVVYVDVRRPDEWAAGRVEGAIHIPHTELADRWPELENYRDADIVLYCRTGRRSGIAEEILREAGFERLHNGGGLSDLQRQGVPVAR